MSNDRVLRCRRSILEGVAFGGMTSIAGCSRGTLDDTSTDTAEQTTKPAASPTDPAEQPTVSADIPTDTPEQPTDTANNPASPSETLNTIRSEPESTPAPNEDFYYFFGDGQRRTNRIEIVGGLITLDLTHTGKGKFTVSLLNVNTNEKELLLDINGDFHGTVATHASEGKYVLDIQAKGGWQIGVAQPRYSSAEISELPAHVSKTDYAVLGPYQFAGMTRVTVDTETDSQVWLLDQNGTKVELMFDESGAFEGSTTTKEMGVGLIYAKITNNWTITLEPT